MMWHPFRRKREPVPEHEHPTEKKTIEARRRLETVTDRLEVVAKRIEAEIDKRGPS